MRIGELASKARVSPSTLRYYESAGLLSPPRRESGRRVYGEEVVTQLQAIIALQFAGFRLAEIRELIAVLADGRKPDVRWERAARAKVKELDSTIADLRRARRMLAKAIDCACGGDPSACSLMASVSRSSTANDRSRNRGRGVRVGRHP